ncbi:MAG: GtrA family protein [Bacteroidetes bacterium]|nr:GtrA family protein [Bacteroidota bacterium]
MKDSQKQVIKYIIIGISAVLVDLIVYYGTSFFIASLSIAKALGFIVGSFYTFFLNKFWTWKDKRKTGVSQLSKFFAIYGVSLLINVAVNEFFLTTLPNFELYLQINKPLQEDFFNFTLQLDKLAAFCLATIASAIWNFFGQKYWVFKK